MKNFKPQQVKNPIFIIQSRYYKVLTLEFTVNVRLSNPKIRILEFRRIRFFPIIVVYSFIILRNMLSPAPNPLNADVVMLSCYLLNLGIYSI